MHVVSQAVMSSVCTRCSKESCVLFYLRFIRPYFIDGLILKLKGQKFQHFLSQDVARSTYDGGNGEDYSREFQGRQVDVKAPEAKRFHFKIATNINKISKRLISQPFRRLHDSRVQNPFKCTSRSCGRAIKNTSRLRFLRHNRINLRTTRTWSF